MESFHFYPFFSNSIHYPPCTSLFSYIYIFPLTSSLRIRHVLVPLVRLQPHSSIHSPCHTISFPPSAAYSSSLSMEEASFFETSVMIYQDIRVHNHVTEGSNMALAVTLTLALRTSPAAYVSRHCSSVHPTGRLILPDVRNVGWISFFSIH